MEQLVRLIVSQIEKDLNKGEVIHLRNLIFYLVKLDSVNVDTLLKGYLPKKRGTHDKQN